MSVYGISNIKDTKKRGMKDGGKQIKELETDSEV